MLELSWEVWKHLVLRESLLWYVIVAMLSAMLVAWVTKRVERKVRESLGVVLFHEFFVVEDRLRQQKRISPMNRLLSFDVMIQRGGFERLDLDIGGKAVNTFRALELLMYWEEQWEALERKPKKSLSDLKDSERIDQLLFTERQNARKEVLQLLKLIVEKEGRGWRRRTYEALKARLEALNEGL